jgi:hypothetical protein
MRRGTGRWTVRRKLRPLMGMVAALMFQAPNHAWAEWVYEIGRDELRGRDTRLALLRSLPKKAGDSAGGAYLVFRERDGGLGAFLMYSGPSVDCPKTGCKVPARFDEGNVLALDGYPTNKRDSLSLSEPKTLLEAARLGRQLIVELATTDKGAVQFKFDLTGFEWPQLDSNAPFRKGLGSLQWGAPVPSELTELTTRPTGNVNCYKGAVPEGNPWKGITIQSASYCFVDARFAYGLIESPATKAGRESLRRAITSVAGEPTDIVLDWERWDSQSGDDVVGLTLISGRKDKGKEVSSLFIVRYRPLDFFKVE